MINLGKYTFEIKLAFVIKLLLLSVNAFEKNYHGNNPAKTKIEYGAELFFDKLAILPNTKVNTNIVKRGLITLQATPITVCLYLTLMSLHERI